MGLYCLQTKGQRSKKTGINTHCISRIGLSIRGVIEDIVSVLLRYFRVGDNLGILRDVRPEPRVEFLRR